METAVFGQVIDGMDAVDKIAKAKRKDEKTNRLLLSLSIVSEIVKDYDFSKQ